MQHLSEWGMKGDKTDLSNSPCIVGLSDCMGDELEGVFKLNHSTAIPLYSDHL